MHSLPMVSRIRVWLPLGAVLIVLLSIGPMFAYGVPSVRARLATYAENRNVMPAARMAAALSNGSRVEREKQLAPAARMAREEAILVDLRGRVVRRAGDADGFAPSRKMLRTARCLASAPGFHTTNGAKDGTSIRRTPGRTSHLWAAVDRFALDPGSGAQARVNSRAAYLQVKLDHLPGLDARAGSGGLGMGLFICKELVEKMGDEISIESQEDSGTNFAIELPEVSDG